MDSLEVAFTMALELDGILKIDSALSELCAKCE